MKSLLSLLTIFIISLFLSNEPQRCEHILIKGDAYGITQVWIEMCMKDEVQVNKFGEHFETERSTKYFE
jgi:hypothetical protein